MVKSQFSYGLPPFSHGFLKESPLSHHKGLPGSLHPHRMHPGQCPAGWRQDAFGAAQWGAGCAAGAWEFAGGSLGNHWVFGKIAQHGRLTHGNIDKNERFLLGKFLKMEVVDVFFPINERFHGTIHVQWRFMRKSLQMVVAIGESIEVYGWKIF